MALFETKPTQDKLLKVPLPASYYTLAAGMFLLVLNIYFFWIYTQQENYKRTVPYMAVESGLSLFVFLALYASQTQKTSTKIECGTLTVLPESIGQNEVFRKRGSFSPTGLSDTILNESEDGYRRLVDLLPDAVFIQADGCFVLVNPAAVRLFGASSDVELLGTSVMARMHPDWHTTVNERIEYLMTGQQSVPAIKEVYLRMDGSVVQVEVSASSITFAGNKGVVVLARDITNQINQERIVERYQALSENVRDIIWFVRVSDGQILEANQAAENAYGYSREEFKKLRIYNLRANQTWETLQSQLNQADSAGITFETTHVKKNGEHFPVEVSSQSITTSGEKVLMSVIRDISERKYVDEQTRKQIVENSQRTQELEAIIEVSYAMRNASTRPQMVSILVKQSMRVTRAQSAALLLLKENTLIVQNAGGGYSEHLGRQIPNQDNILWDVFRSAQIKVSRRNQPSPHPVFGALLPDFQSGLDTVTYAPLKAGPVTIGLLILGFEDQTSVPEHQVRLISAIAEMAGSALHRMSMTETMEKIVTDRTSELEYIYQVSSSASAATDVHQALQQALDQTLQAVGAEAGVIYLLNDDNLTLRLAAGANTSSSVYVKNTSLPVEGSIPGWVVQHREPLILPNLAADPRSRMFVQPTDLISFAGLPMRVRSRVVGMLGINKPGREQFNLEEMMLLSFIADHIGLVVDHFHLYQQAEKSAILEERSRMARELHDSVTQSLYSASLFSAGAIKFIEMNKLDQVKEYLFQLTQVTQQALKEMRLMVYELRSSDLSSGGLAGALQIRLDTVERRSGIKTNLIAHPLPPLSEQLEQDLFRIALEALNNTIKHSQASEVEIGIKYSDGTVCLSVHDNGKGFDPSTSNSGIGLLSMSERANRWNGRFNIYSAENAGCDIVVSIPTPQSIQG